MFENELKALLKKAVKTEVRLEQPPDPALGDFAFPCFQLAREWRKSPHTIAEEIAAKIPRPQFIEKIVATGGYVNFFVRKQMLASSVLTDIAKQKNKYGSSNEGRGKTVVVEYSSPNIAKPFSIGHLRSTVIGNSIYLLHNFAGYKTVRINHLGDWGTQFGKLMVAYTKWGKGKKPTIEYLLQLYIKFHNEAEKKPELEDEARQWFKKLEDSDKKAVALWKKFRDISLAEFKRIYKLLNVDFDYWQGESFYNKMLDAAVKEVDKKPGTEYSEGALIVNLEPLPPVILRKTDEASTYATRDIAAALYRVKTFKPGRILYVVGSEQKLHFQQIFAVLQKMGYEASVFQHVNFGLYRIEGEKMGTRKGKVVFIEDVIRKAMALVKKAIAEKNPKLKNKDKVAVNVAIGALIFADLANDRIRDIDFDWSRILDFEGDTGPYVQYTHARAASIIQKAAKKKMKVKTAVDADKLVEDVEKRLLTMLSQFTATVASARQQLKPHILAQYLLALCRCFNEFYHKCPVMQEEEKVKAEARLLLVECSRQVIQNGLSLLGIKSPGEM